MEDQHRCRIDTTTDDPFYPGHPGYVVVCDACDQEAGPFADAHDAHRAAAKHDSRQGVWG